MLVCHTTAKLNRRKNPKLTEKATSSSTTGKLYNSYPYVNFLIHWWLNTSFHFNVYVILLRSIVKYISNDVMWGESGICIKNNENNVFLNVDNLIEQLLKNYVNISKRLHWIWSPLTSTKELTLIPWILLYLQMF